MDSFLGLFNPNISDNDNEQQESDEQYALPPEPQAGNIEYKLKIVNPTKQRFEHLVTQVLLLLYNHVFFFVCCL